MSNFSLNSHKKNTALIFVCDKRIYSQLEISNRKLVLFIEMIENGQVWEEPPPYLAIGAAE